MVYSLPCSLFSTISQRLHKFMSIESVMLSISFSTAPLLLLPSVFPRIRVFSNESALHIKWPKYWSFSTSPSWRNIQGWFFLRPTWKDWLFGLLAVQGIFKGLLQHHNLKASILWCPVFFMVQLSHPYVTAGKTIGLTIWIFIGKMMSLAF